MSNDLYCTCDSEVQCLRHARVEDLTDEQPHPSTAVGAIDQPPAHYATDTLQPFDIIDAYELDFYEGNALKYLLRWRRKGGIQDLLKAKHYIDELIVRAANGDDA